MDASSSRSRALRRSSTTAHRRSTEPGAIGTFLAQLYCEQTGYLRLTVQRCLINKDGSWVGGITWDELMAVKLAVGLGDRWAVEVYPPADAVVNVANMRHLFLLNEPPPYAWRTKSAPVRTETNSA